jgi:hypothetical protein
VLCRVTCRYTWDDNKELCKKYGANGYPTIKYFTGATAALGDAYKAGLALFTTLFCSQNTSS